MITKGTEDYKKAQRIANDIVRLADYHRWYNNSYYDIAFEKVGNLLWDIKKLGCFAAKVAETIYGTMGKFSRVAYISEKQAWILACAALENNIDFNEHITEEDEEEEVVLNF